jgi:hypothetical protein
MKVLHKFGGSTGGSHAVNNIKGIISMGELKEF